MHYFNGTGLRCAPPTCVVHHGAQGGPMFVRSGGSTKIFVADNEHANQGSHCSSVPIHFGSAQHTLW